MFVNSRRWALLKPKLIERFESILWRWIFSIMPKINDVELVLSSTTWSKIPKRSSDVSMKWLAIFFSSKIDDRWTVTNSKFLTILRSRVLSIAHSIGHERTNSSFSSEMKRMRSVTESIKKTRKCRRVIFFIKSLIKRLIKKPYWWSVSMNFLIWCVWTTVSRNISKDWPLKNVRMSAKDFRIKKLLTADWWNW